MQRLLHDGLLRDSSCENVATWRKVKVTRSPTDRFSKFLGGDHVVGILYGLVNFIVCVPALVSYAHIVFPQPEFADAMPELVKLYYLCSAVMQMTMTLSSTIVFSIGQVQDVGLIFLAGMVRNIITWAHQDGLTVHEIVATSLWQCATSTFFTGVCLVIIGRLQLSQYVQMIPLPVVGGYLGYIGYFCLAAGLSIGSGKNISGPETMVQLLDASLQNKLILLSTMTAVMMAVHFKVKHFMGMPTTLLVLPIMFFTFTSALGISADDCRASGWLPPLDSQLPSASNGVLQFFDPAAVQWWYLPGQFLNVCGLAIIVSFGSSLDIAAIQAEMGGQKINYNQELVTIGLGNLASGVVGGATGSYIFSQTIFSAKRGVKSRLNGLVVSLGEAFLFFAPVDILPVLPNSYIGGIMCLFGIDIMNDWLIQSYSLMAPSEYILVWVSFGITLWLSSTGNFGVIEGMALGTVFAALAFVVAYTRALDHWQAVPGRSSVVRPPSERRILNEAYTSIFAVSLSSFVFFGASLHMVQGIEEEAERRSARFVCLDLGRLGGLDSTAADQLRLLVLSLERARTQVMLSSMRSKTTQRLLEAHGVIGAGRPAFATLDQALQHCEEELLSARLGSTRRSGRLGEQPLDTLLLEYVDGFISDPTAAAVAAKAALEATAHFRRLQLEPEAKLFGEEDPANAIFIVAGGSVRLSSHREWATNVTSALLPSPTTLPVITLAQMADNDFSQEVMAFSRASSNYSTRETHEDDFSPPPDESAEHVRVGGILCDMAFFARRRCGCNAVAEGRGCVVYVITRKTMDKLELSNPALVVFLQKVLLRDLSQLAVQFLCPLQAVGGLS